MDFKTPCNHCGQNIAFPAQAIGLQTNCPHCGQTTTLTATATPTPVPTPTAVAIPVRAVGSPVINGNTVNLGGTFYQLSQINSVRIAPGSVGIVSVLGLGLCAMLAFGSVANGLGGAKVPAESWVMCGVFALFALALFARIVQMGRTHTLMLTTSSREVAALRSTNRPQLEATAQAIVTAISNR